MKTFHEEIPDLCQDALTDQLFDEHSIFFDIETTGFSPANSTLYMIGCARRKSNRICIDQFFAEKPEEEAEILAAFFQMLSPYTTIITFNGVGFDIPYLKAKADHYKIPEHFRDFEYLDIFKSVSSIKFLLKLENYKQKTIESFLGLKRKDEKTGGDLIHVYFTHVKHPTEETMHLLRIHNYEDVLHMIDLLSVLSYLEVLNGQYTILSHRIDHYHAYDGTEGEEWIITMQNDYPVPRQLSCKQDCFYLMIGKNRTSLRIPVYEGELHYFYSNYRDYYYLKKEDMAIYLLFIQHILYSLKENGKAAIVVPTGFITAKKGIEYKIRKYIVDNQFLTGVISMPANIFATTNTSVSILFLDKSKNNDMMIFLDASKCGEKIKDGKNQKIILRPNETSKIIDYFLNKTEEDKFSSYVSLNDVKGNNYSFSAGQYFDVKIEYDDISSEEFSKNMINYNKKLDELFLNDEKIKEELKHSLEVLYKND